MVSRIVVHRPNEFLSIKHLGTVKVSVKERQSADGEDWAGAFENYTLRETNGSSTLTIEMDVKDEYRSYFQETWPKALSKLKGITETEERFDRYRTRKSA